MSKKNSDKLWFKAKSFGWGWVPVTWQGWVIIFVFLLLFIFSWINLLSGQNLIINIFIIIVDFGLLFFICYKKGEKPRWRWGK
jgi:hypothetical protein